MTIGPSVFGNDRRELWVAENANLTDKLKHFLPRLRNAIPSLTDVFLPESAGSTNRQQVINTSRTFGAYDGFFCHTWAAPHGRTATAMVDAALSARDRMGGGGALELNIEGIPDDKLRDYITAAVKRVRFRKPNLPLRINVVPFKGRYLPDALIRSDNNLFVVAQTYGGNMEILYAADEVRDDLIAYIGDPSKCSVMHAVMCSRNGGPRQVVLPHVRNKGAFYIDDLLLDAGLL